MNSSYLTLTPVHAGKLVALVDDLLLAVDADKADGAEAGVDGLDRNESTRPIGARGPIFARIVCRKIFIGKLVIVTFLQWRDNPSGFRAQDIGKHYSTVSDCTFWRSLTNW